MESRLLNGVSVIICCYNSAWIIERTLEALKCQKVRKGLLWEIILVDNNCTDDTVEKSQKSMQDCPVPFIVVKEKKSGLANARKRGIAKAKYDIAIYCDDDNLLCPDYIDTMYGIMLSDPQIGAAGGKGIAEYQVEPDEIVRKNSGAYAVGSQKSHDCWLYGAGVTLRTNLVKEIYEHQRCYLMGRKGKELLSGDDSELVMSMVVRGYRIAPTDDVYYTHVLKANRLTAEYYEKLLIGLVRPAPVFDVFRAVIYDDSFKSILYRYYESVRAVLWSFWRYNHADAYRVRVQHKERLARYNYWGLLKLWWIYMSWKHIKKNANITNYHS